MLASMAKREQFRSLWLQRYDLVSKEPKENVFFFVLSNGSIFSRSSRYEKISKKQKKKQFFCLPRTIFPPYWLNGALLPAVASTLPCCRLDSREQSGSQQGSCQRQYSWSNRKYSKSIRNFFRSIVFNTGKPKV